MRCLMVALVALQLGRKRKNAQRIGIVLLGGALAFGYVALWTASCYTPALQLAGDTHRIEAVITQWPEETDYGYSVIASLQMEDSPAVSILLYVGESDLQPGDQISTIARLKDARYASSGEEITYYNAKGIFLYGTTYGTIEIDRPDSIPLTLLPAHWSHSLEEGISSAFSELSAPLITALVTGNRASLADEFTSSLQRTGLSHTVAVSGMHLAFLAGLLSLLLGRNRPSTAMVIIPVSILFALVIGGTPSITRATIMIVMLQLAPLFGRETDGITSLSFALFLILLSNPYSVNHVGLQLSFTSVAGIFFCSDRIYRGMRETIPLKIKRSTPIPLKFVDNCLVFILASLSATLGAMVFTTPLVAYHFGAVSLIAPLSNLLTLWAVAFCFAGGMVIGGLSLVWQGASLLGQMMDPLVRYLDWMVTLLGRIPFASLPTDSIYGVGWLVLVYVVVAYSIWRRERVRPWLSFCVILLGLVVTIGLYVEENRLGDISVSVLDVGQGQSVFLRMGETTLLVDCGGSDDVEAGDTAADAIQGAGHFALDYLVLTHCHADHAGGVTQLLRRMDVGMLVLPASEGEDDGLRSEILEEAEAANIPVLLISRQEELETDRGTVALFPPLDDADENERGLTALATYGDFDTLITGDMGSEIEAVLVERYQLPEVELYVVGHHGSKYSSSQLLLDEITPAMAAISVGQNAYGHPTDEVLERLDDMGTTVYRTDWMGTITVRVGG